MPKDKYDSPNPRRAHTIMSVEDVQAGKKSSWYELEITGTVRNLCPELWRLQHLTSLYLNDNNLSRIPPDIARLEHLTYLDLSSNKLRHLPGELGDLIHLRELLLNYNQLRVLPFELGKLFNLQNLGLLGNPLAPEMLKLYNENQGTQKLLGFLLDSLAVVITLTMGKDEDGPVRVKREVVSANVELIREEYPMFTASAVQPCVPQTCKKCLRERTKGSASRYRQKGRRKQPSRANTPIVIQLKDTLRAAIQQRQRSQSDVVKHKVVVVKGDLDTETDASSDRGDYVEMGENKKRKNAKNFSAFLNVIEKAHTKEPVGMESNLSSEPASNEKLVAEYVLNNASSQGRKAAQSVGKKRSIIECENIDLICNDLTSVEESVCDDTESEIGSTTSSSEIQSEDSDVSNTRDSPAQEFTPEELQRLAEYTTGCPLVRYECPPSQCPQCQWYDAQMCQAQYSQYNAEACSPSFSTKSTNSTYSFHNHHHDVPTLPSETENDEISISDTESSDDFVDTHTPSESSNDIDIDTCENYSVTSYSGSDKKYKWSEKPVTHKQLLDIDIAGRQGKSNSSTNHFPDSVYIDLTDTDVTFTVYYHQNLTSLSHTNAAATSTASLSTTTSSNYASYAREPSSNSSSFHHHSQYSLFMPANPMPTFTLPYYTPQYISYWPTYYPMYSITSPFCLPPDSNIPKTAMIPPSQLSKFNATQPPHRQWIPLSRPEQNRPAAIFTVMCYNILCDKYCTRQQYGYCPSWGLNWEYRKKGILEEIRGCSADVICLQEVETEVFYSFMKPELERDGYTGIFSPKSRARTMTEQERKHVDGCAIFYRTSKFRLIKEHLIEFNQLAMANAEGSDNMLNRVMTKDNIGLAALLETREGVYESGGGMPSENQIKQPLLVATAHIHWDPEFSDVKLIQTVMLMWELKKIVEDSVRSFRPGSNQPNCNAIPMILCGDLNSLPDSGVIEYLTSGKVAINHEDFKEIVYEACLQAFNCAGKESDSMVTHNFRLSRAYESDIMPYTNYTYDFKGIIDYIFYSRDYMNLLGLLGPLDEDWFLQNKIVGCPHPHIPSDHFPLFVEFEMPVPLQTQGGSNRSGNVSSAGSSSSSATSSSQNTQPKLR